MAQANATKEMLAYRYHSDSREPLQETIPIPSPGPSEVLIKILAAGLCHSDLSILYPELAPAIWPYVFTMGHEGAGVIVEVGSEVPLSHPELKVDTYVAIHACNPCLDESCSNCSSGKDNLCMIHGPYGLGTDGAWASHCTVRAKCVVRIPGDIHSIPPPIAAIATDAILTPYHALKTCIGIRPEQTLLVMGCGGLGNSAIQLAKNSLGVKSIVGCDVRDVSLGIAKTAGAQYTAKPEGLAELIQQNNLHIDVVIDFVGNQQSFDTAFAVVGGCGTIHIVGMGAKDITFPLLGIAAKDLTIKSSFWGRREELPEVLEALARGEIKMDVDIRGFQDIPQALRDMAAGKLKTRAVFIP
ncbi:hypothetical protein NLI96_g13 [Meripilus lineatus]|uniref:Enoyl reductase (ER) domain-containing protein n=1 Tax=Meripilus lineatus TaxID=2056292 RepID=A0AAD5VD94_9APHY|nr:hypothetical protein NLI96_g13 [Physisporinus lineatus]